MRHLNANMDDIKQGENTNNFKCLFIFLLFTVVYNLNPSVLELCYYYKLYELRGTSYEFELTFAVGTLDETVVEVREALEYSFMYFYWGS